MRRRGTGSTPSMSRRQLLATSLAALATVALPRAAVAVAEASRRWQVATDVEGRGPFRFFVDTGAERSAVSAFLADALGHRVAALPSVRRDGVVGSRSTPEVQLTSLRCDAVERQSIAALVLPDTVLGDWDGLIGADMLQGNTLSVHAPDWRVTLAATDGWKPIAGRGVRFTSGTLHLPSLRLSIGGRAVTALLDTGAVHSVANRALAQALDLQAGDTAVVTDAAGARLPARLAVAPGFRLDAAALPAAALRIADLPLFERRGLADRPAVLLGLDKLSSLASLQIDFRSRRLHAR